MLAPFSQALAIECVDVTWEGFVLDYQSQSQVQGKTLYICGNGAEKVELRESIVALLELAGERLECESFIIALDRKSSALETLIHSLLYVGFQPVTAPAFPVDPSYVLLGIEV